MSKANKMTPVGPPSRRLNLRAVIILLAVVILAVPGYFVLRYYWGQKGQSSYLAEARRALAAGRLEMAYSYANNYLAGSPKDLDALDIKGQILDRLARDSRGVEEAVRVQTQILALDPDRMEARKRLIALNLRSGKYRAAEAAAEEYLNRGADDAEAHRLMARALEGVGYLGDAAALDGDPDLKGVPRRPYNAIAEYEKAERLQPGDIDGGYRLALLYQSRGKDPAKSFELMDRLLAANPKSVAARLARFRFFANQSTETEANLGRARGELEAALALDPGNVEANLFKAELAVNRGDTGGAKKFLAAIDPPPQNDLRVNLLKGMIEFREQHSEEGIQTWRSGLIQTGGTNVDLSWRLARVLITLGRLAEARPLMAQYLRLSGSGEKEPTPEYRYLVALEDLKLGRVKEAVAGLEQVRDKFKGNLVTTAQHLVTLGDAYAANRDEARAMDAYRRASAMAGSGAQPWLAMARMQLADRPAEGISTLERGLASLPNDPSLLTYLAQVLLQQELGKPADGRDWKEFNRWLDRADSTLKNSPEVALLRAEHLAATGQVEAALKQIEQATANSPAAIMPWLARVNALARLNRADEALETLKAAVKAAGENAQFRIAQAQILLRRGEPRVAYEALAEGLDRVPADQRGQLWRSLGDFHRGRSDFVAARGAYEEWAKLQPQSAEPHLQLLGLAAAAGDGPAMEAQAEAVRKVVGPDSTVGKLARAEVLLKLKPRSGDGRSGEDKARLDEAAKLIAEIKAANPRQPAGLLLEAQLMERLGRTDDVIAAYKAALELRGGSVALRPLVILLTREKRPEEVEELRKKVASFPIEMDQLAGQLKVQMGDTAEAEQMADRMLRGDPLSLDAAVWKAKVLNTLGKPAEAEATLRMLAQQKPEDAGIWIRLMMFQVSQKEMEKARATLEEMKQKVKSERPELLWAACYRVLNMRAEADEAFAASLKRWPDDPGVLQAAIDYYEVTGRAETAEASLRHLLSIRPGFDWARRRLALNLSARPNDSRAMSEAMGLVGEASSGAESPEDRQLRAAVLSRSPDPKHRAEAIRILEALAAEVPYPAKLHELLARSLYASGEQAKAGASRAEAVGDRAKAGEMRARSVDERAKAREYAAKAAGVDDASPDMILFDAVLRLQDKDVAGAEGQLARLEKADKKADKRALATIELRARILHEKGEDAVVDRLVAETFDAHRTAPDGLAAGIGLLKLLMNLERPDAAERLGAELSKLDSRGKIAFAEYLGGRGKVKEARALLGDAAKAGPDAEAAAARSSLAMAGEFAATRQEWLQEADGLLNLALKGHPESIELIQTQAYLRHLQRDYEGEIKLYDSLIAKSSNSHILLNNMAWTLSEEMGRPKEGLEKIEAAIAKAGKQAHLIDTRGVILLRLGRVDDALKDLQDAAAVLPSGPLYYHLARAYKAAGKPAESEKYRDLARGAGLDSSLLQPSERDEAEKQFGIPGGKAAAEPATASRD